MEENRNIYVGHRYVPKIMGAWNKDEIYEGLSIVTHEGNSWTSKKRVPIGIDISNEEYWSITGNYNAQIDYYREDVKDVKEQLLVTTDELSKKEDVFNVAGYVKTDLATELQGLIDLAHTMNYKKIILPKGVHDVTNHSYYIPSNTHVMGSNTILNSNGTRLNPIFYLEGNNITIEGIEFNMNQSDSGDDTSLSQSQTAITIEKTSDNISIESCTFKKGYSGFWIQPIEKGIHTNTHIENCTFEQLNHPIYLGLNTTDGTNRTDFIDTVRIINNTILNGYANSDGVKTIQNVKNVLIDGNLIDGMQRDGLDLFASGENVVVTNNIIRNSVHQGIDIKDSFTSPYANGNFGHNRGMIISNNIIENNFYGIGISGSVHGITINNNIIRGNRVRGISLHGRHVTISNNEIFGNCLTPNDASGAIHLYSDETISTENITITSNNIFNNGLANNEAYGVKIYSASKHITIDGNAISNDSLLENPHQKIGLFIIGTAKLVKIGKNSISGHSRDVWIKNGAVVIGETVMVNLKGDPDPASAYNIDNTLITGNDRKSILDIKLINSKGYSAGTEYLNYRLRRAVNGILDTSSITTVNTQQGTLPYVPLVMNVFGDGDITNDPRKIKTGETLVMNVQSVGTLPVTDLVAEINYIEY